MTNEDLDDREWPDDDDGNDDTAPCPHCGRMIYDDAEQCPECGRYLSREDRPRSRPSWIVIGFLLCMLVVLTWILGR